MKKILFSMTMMCLLAFAALAQTKTDFSGNWELDTINSRLDERMRVESMRLKVDQTEKDITVGTFSKRTLTSDGGRTQNGSTVAQAATYTLVPGAAMKGETMSGGGQTSAQTTVHRAAFGADGKLKLNTVRSFETEAGKVEIKIEEIWELTDEGKTLKVTRTTEGPNGMSSSDLVFTKKETADVPAATGAVTGGRSTAPKMISGGVLNGKATSLAKPAYPDAARAVKASGAVNVQVTIDEEGNVVSASAVSGHPLLRQASEEAARASKFSPTLLEGVPVKVTGIVVYNFVP